MVIRSVGVIGSGTMGAGIAQTTAQHGYQVVLFDRSEEIVNKSKAAIDRQIDRLAEKGKLSAEAAADVKGAIRTTVRLSDMQECQLVIEAVPESMDIKRDVFRKLDESCPGETILASNTSSFSITRSQPKRVFRLGWPACISSIRLRSCRWSRW